MKKFVSAVALSCVGALGITGCAAQAAGVEASESATAARDGGPDADAGPDADGGTTSTTTAALTGGGGAGGLGFTCSPIGCICNGDYDCNNMFGAGVCDGRNPRCYERGPGPVYCVCYASAAPTRGAVTVAPIATTAVAQ